MGLPKRLRGRLVSFIAALASASSIGYPFFHGWYVSRTFSVFTGVLFTLSLALIVLSLLIKV